MLFVSKQYITIEIHVLLHFQGILNKLTPQKFKELAEQAQNLEINTEDRLRGCIDKIFKKVLSLVCCLSSQFIPSLFSFPPSLPLSLILCHLPLSVPPSLSLLPTPSSIRPSLPTPSTLPSLYSSLCLSISNYMHTCYTPFLILYRHLKNQTLVLLMLTCVE